MKEALVAVALGRGFVKQTEGMASSFLEHNPNWEIERFYDEKLLALLPSQCSNWSDFNKCEIGRWMAIKQCLEKYDIVVYSDGDMRWYSKYEPSQHAIALFPHYVTNRARMNARHWIMKDGAANIGILEMQKSNDAIEAVDFVVSETLANPTAHMHGGQLWLQNMVSTLPDCGFDCTYNNHCGYNVAAWNLRKGDREVCKENGKYVVKTNTGVVEPLVSFHFSNKSLNSLVNFGNCVCRLREEYLRELL